MTLRVCGLLRRDWLTLGIEEDGGVQDWLLRCGEAGGWLWFKR